MTLIYVGAQFESLVSGGTATVVKVDGDIVTYSFLSRNGNVHTSFYVEPASSIQDAVRKGYWIPMNTSLNVAEGL